MAQEYIITMTAENRVGILAAVTNAMAELGADLRECSQTIVRGYFTMLFAAEFPDTREEFVIHDHLRDVCKPFGIEVSLKRSPGTDSTEAPEAEKHLRLSALDTPGMLRQIAGKLSAAQIDIIGMRAWRDSETSRFEIMLKMGMPASFNADKLLDELRNIDASWDLQAELT